MTDAYREFILNAAPPDLIHQLSHDLKEPLVSAQAIVNMLMMMQNPSPALTQKLESGELDPAQMLHDLTDNLTRALDVIDFYRETLDST